MAASPRRTRSNDRSQGTRQGRRGFTLIEMLIAVTLVLLMMVLFAEIFGLAGESMTLQQAIADGDQQVRSFTTVLRADLQKRTMRTAVPFAPTEDPDYAGVPFSDRQGYFYLSLNDPDNAGDNLLQFTVRSTILDENGDETPYFGKSTGLVQRTDMTGAAIGVNAQDSIRRNPQQPEHDDGELATNFTASSSAAEISYFMRGGRLYRRQVLIRNPLTVSGTNSAEPRLTWDTAGSQPIPTPIEFLRHYPANPTSPVQTNGGAYLRYDPSTPSRSSDSDDYWNDFDNGAFLSRILDPGGSGNLVLDGARMTGVGLLNNASDISATETPPLAMTTGPNPLIRTTRFGFDQTNGISREFTHSDPAAAGFAFLGRFTLEEMSHLDFNFPQNPSTNANVGGTGNPLSYIDYPAAVDAVPIPDGTVDDFTAGDRRGQDLLLSNVHAFEVEVWDDRLGRFVQPGHSLTNGADIGDFHRNRNLHFLNSILQVPGDPTVWNAGQSARWGYRIFDTWHRQNDPDGPGPGPAVPPPYRPMTFYPPGSPNGPYASRGTWQPNTQYNVNDVVFPAANRPLDFSFYYICVAAGISPPEEDVNGNEQLDPPEDTNGNGMLDPGEDLNGNGVLDPSEDANANGRLETEPGWPTVNRARWYGRREDVNNNGTLDGGEDFNGNGILDGEPHWIAVRNVRPLRAIRVRVRFFHESSSRMRQVSIVHSLTNENPF